MSLMMAYCADHKRYVDESNVMVGLFEFLLVGRWMEEGHLEHLGASCSLCASGPLMTLETMTKAVELEARAIQNGGQLTTDKLSLKL